MSRATGVPSERRPAVRIHRRRELRRLDLPYDAESVETNGRELRVRHGGWPVSCAALDTMVEAVVRLATDPRAV